VETEQIVTLEIKARTVAIKTAGGTGFVGRGIFRLKVLLMKLPIVAYGADKRLPDVKRVKPNLAPWAACILNL
jgi:hypothetical protein